jgi:hypothetical protein
MARSSRAGSGWQSRQHAAQGGRRDAAMPRIREAVQDGVPVLLVGLLLVVIFLQK